MCMWFTVTYGHYALAQIYKGLVYMYCRGYI